PVLTEKELAIHLLEIERVVESTAHAWILEFVAARIEGERLHDADAARWKLFPHHPSLPYCGEVVGVRPFLSAVFDAPINLVTLEGLECDGGITKELVADDLEIARPDDDVEVPAPIVIDPLINQRAAGREILEPVGPRAKRRLERGLRDVTLAAGLVDAFPPMFRQHRQLANDLW